MVYLKKDIVLSQDNFKTTSTNIGDVLFSNLLTI